MPVEFTKAFYIKLGKGGGLEEDSIKNNKLRFGWDAQSILDINAGAWGIIEEQLRANDGGKRLPASTIALNTLMTLAQDDPDAVWITFHQSKMWWTRLAPGPVQVDNISKFRMTSLPWCDHAPNGLPFAVDQIPGKISQLQGFRATLCKVSEVEVLKRTINGIRSREAVAIRESATSLARLLETAIKALHWKDFERLADMVFRHAGWIRVSVLGEQAKGYDFILEEPIIGERYVVQVKSKAGLSELTSTISNFTTEDFRKVFFVVHSPYDDLINATDIPEPVEIVTPQRLGELALDAGLVSWIEEKVA